MSVFSQVVSSATIGDNDVKTVIFHILQQLSKNDATLFACILWSIWKQHNNQIWNNVIDAQSFVFSRVVSMLQDWRVVRDAAVTSGTTTQAEVQRSWRKSMVGRVKCNIDASFPVKSILTESELVLY
ncbi:hypothetical protein QL285_070262 [Trifolium repens]|nr:hypothetical protein QL285_070262 [Trifolium repens]